MILLIYAISWISIAFSIICFFHRFDICLKVNVLQNAWIETTANPIEERTRWNVLPVISGLASVTHHRHWWHRGTVTGPRGSAAAAAFIFNTCLQFYTVQCEGAPPAPLVSAPVTSDLPLPPTDPLAAERCWGGSGVPSRCLSATPLLFPGSDRRAGVSR